jgi:hypothetical protein
MPDSSEYLESLMKKLELIEQIKAGAQKVVEGGIVGIQSAAETHPQLLIDAITNLVKMVDLLQTDINDAAVQMAAMRDTIEEISNILK